MRDEERPQTSADRAASQLPTPQRDARHAIDSRYFTRD
jgi:hypothetical protein